MFSFEKDSFSLAPQHARQFNPAFLSGLCLYLLPILTKRFEFFRFNQISSRLSYFIMHLSYISKRSTGCSNRRLYQLQIRSKDAYLDAFTSSPRHAALLHIGSCPRISAVSSLPWCAQPDGVIEQVSGNLTGDGRDSSSEGCPIYLFRQTRPQCYLWSHTSWLSSGSVGNHGRPELSPEKPRWPR